LVEGQRVLLAVDDSPTKRYGPKVQGAGIHHHPTPGPAGHKFLYGQIWVAISLLLRHPLWQTRRDSPHQQGFYGSADQ